MSPPPTQFLVLTFEDARRVPHFSRFLREVGKLPLSSPHARTANPILALTFEDARRTVEEHASHVAPGAEETTDLLHAAGRVLAEPVTADRDIPPFPRSTRDGYAVRSADLASLPAKLTVMGEIKAGPAQVPSPLKPGGTFSIMTGAPVPQGADAVVMIEYTSLQNEGVEVTRGVSPGENIVPQGAEAKRGSLLLDSRHPPERISHRPRRLSRQIASAGFCSSTRRRSDHW